MLIRQELQAILEDLSDQNLEVLMQVARSMKKANQTPQALTTSSKALGSPIRPKGFQTLAKRAPHDPLPLAKEYSHAMQQKDSPESQNLLRKVMFTPLSELLSWVNQTPTTDIEISHKSI